jgi:hypothetical protein
LIAACGTDGPKPETDAGPEDSGRDVTVSDMSTSDDVATAADASTGEDASTEDTGPDEDMASADSGADMPPDAGTDLGEDTGGDMQTAGDGDTCGVAIDATVGGTFTGDTSTADDDYSASAFDTGCPSGSVSGGDIVYRIEPTVETTYDLTVTPDDANFDPFLYIRTDCALDECVDGSVLNGEGDPESLTDVTVPANTAYYVIVDGELGSSGAYTFEVMVQ